MSARVARARWQGAKIRRADDCHSPALRRFLRSQITCMKCKFESNTYDPFLDLSLEMAPTVQQAFKKFTVAETLSGQNKYRCSRCKSLQNAQKQLLVHQSPLI